MGSPQALSEADRRRVAAWAADCAEHVLGVFLAAAPEDDRPRALVERTRAWARGELRTADEIRRRFEGGVGAGEVTAPAAAAAARAAGQAAAVGHMGAHALGAAAHAALAAGLADPARPEAEDEEVRWQLDHAAPDVRASLSAYSLFVHGRSGGPSTWRSASAGKPATGPAAGCSSGSCSRSWGRRRSGTSTPPAAWTPTLRRLCATSATSPGTSTRSSGPGR